MPVAPHLYKIVHVCKCRQISGNKYSLKWLSLAANWGFFGTVRFFYTEYLSFLYFKKESIPPSPF